MKKGLLAAALGCALVSTASQADTIAGVYVGAQTWQTDTSGGFADSNNTTDFNFDDENNTSVYIAFEHEFLSYRMCAPPRAVWCVGGEGNLIV